MKIICTYYCFSIFSLIVSTALSFSIAQPPAGTNTRPTITQKSNLFPQPRHATALPAATLPTTEGKLPENFISISNTPIEKEQEENFPPTGRFAFKTKYGYLSPFAIYYGLTSIFWAMPWYASLTLCEIMNKATKDSWDRLRRIPVLLNQTWLCFVLTLTRSFPKVENKEILKKFYKE
jgi:hypothetical protein